MSEPIDAGTGEVGARSAPSLTPSAEETLRELIRLTNHWCEALLGEEAPSASWTERAVETAASSCGRGAATRSDTSGQIPVARHQWSGRLSPARPAFPPPTPPLTF